jgi:hypothetical protein
MELIRKLAELDRNGIYLLAKRDIEKIFPEEKEKALDQSLRRMVADGLLLRVTRGLYLNPAASNKSPWVIEDIAKTLRPGNLSYTSLESSLSEYGLISQVPLSRITVMTTGVKGVHETPFGTIEFTHTKRSPAEILNRTIAIKGRPLRMATKLAAVEDLRRVGRNCNMLNEEELRDITNPNQQ